MSHEKKTPRQRPAGRPVPRRAELESWLRAEAEGREAAAEAALATLLRGVDRLAPPVGFADRVLAGMAGETPRTAAARAAGSRWRWPLGVRGSIAAALTVAAACWLLAPALGVWLLGPAAQSVSVAELLDGIGRAVDWTTEGLTRLGGLWDLLSGLARAIATAAGTLPVATILLVGLGVAGLALRALSDLIARERSWSHVHYGG